MIRGVRGQTSAEYLGVLFLVAVIIAALVAGAPGPRIAGALQHTICTVFGDDCGERVQRAGPASTPAPIARAAATPRPDPPLRPEVGEVDDYGGGLAEMIFGGEPYAVLYGQVLEVQQNGVPLGPVIRTVTRALGVGKKAWNAAKLRARPFGIPPGLLLACEKAARHRARELQQQLPRIERERFKTIAVGVGRAPDGSFRVIIGSNNPNGVLPKALRGAVNKGEIVAQRVGNGHAEVQVLRYMEQNGFKPITVGAGRPICTECADFIARRGATAASKLK